MSLNDLLGSSLVAEGKVVEVKVSTNTGKPERAFLFDKPWTYPCSKRTRLSFKFHETLAVDNKYRDEVAIIRNKT